MAGSQKPPPFLDPYHLQYLQRFQHVDLSQLGFTLDTQQGLVPRATEDRFERVQLIHLWDLHNTSALYQPDDSFTHPTPFDGDLEGLVSIDRDNHGSRLGALKLLGRTLGPLEESLSAVSERYKCGSVDGAVTAKKLFHCKNDRDARRLFGTACEIDVQQYLADIYDVSLASTNEDIYQDIDIYVHKPGNVLIPVSLKSSQRLAARGEVTVDVLKRRSPRSPWTLAPYQYTRAHAYVFVGYDMPVLKPKRCYRHVLYVPVGLIGTAACAPCASFLNSRPHSGTLNQVYNVDELCDAGAHLERSPMPYTSRYKCHECFSKLLSQAWLSRAVEFNLRQLFTQRGNFEAANCLATILAINTFKARGMFDICKPHIERVSQWLRTNAATVRGAVKPHLPRGVLSSLCETLADPADIPLKQLAPTWYYKLPGL